MMNYTMQAPAVNTIFHELQFLTSRSSGPGGQNVNKVNSKVTLRWNIGVSQALTADQKELLLSKLKSRLTNEGDLILTAQESRSQQDNKTAVVQKLDALIKKAFERKKVRKATKPSKAAKQKRIDSKRKQSEKKKWRSNPE